MRRGFPERKGESPREEVTRTTTDKLLQLPCPGSSDQVWKVLVAPASSSGTASVPSPPLSLLPKKLSRQDSGLPIEI